MGSIYTQPRQLALTLTPGGQSLSETLDGWQANTAIVDNYGAQYVYLPDAPKYIDPGTRHAVVPLPSASIARAIYQAPPGVVQPPAGPNDAALITFLEEGHQAQSGVLASQGTEVLDAIGSAGTQQKGSFNLPMGTQSLAVVTIITGASAGSFGMSGANSGFGYYGDKLGTSAIELIAVDPVLDPTINWQIDPGTAGVIWHVTAFPFPAPTISRHPAPWQAGATIVETEVSAAGSTSLAPAIAGQKILLFGWSLQVDGQTAGTTIAVLEDDTGGVGHRQGFIVCTGANASMNSGNANGAPLQAGFGSGLHLNVLSLGTGATVRAVASISRD